MKKLIGIVNKCDLEHDTDGIAIVKITCPTLVEQ
jgi:hypothetical protein